MSVPAGAIDVLARTEATFIDKVAAAMTAAAANPAGTGNYDAQAGVNGGPLPKAHALTVAAHSGPTQTMGVCWIKYQPGGSNVHDWTRTLLGKSRVLIMVDSGVTIRWAMGASTTWLIDCSGGQTDFGFTVGDPSRSLPWDSTPEQWSQGKWGTDDLAATGSIRKPILNLGNCNRWLFEKCHSRQSFQTQDNAACVIVGGGGSGIPKNGCYRFHSCEGAAAGWGTNQLSDNVDCYVEDVRTDGGHSALHIETDRPSAGGWHRCRCDWFYARHATHVVSLSPHGANSSDLQIGPHIYGESVLEGITLATGTGGLFTKTIVNGACIWGGAGALDRLDNVVPSAYALRNIGAAGSDVTFSNILRSGTFSAGSPGGVTSPSCTSAVAKTVDPAYPPATNPLVVVNGTTTSTVSLSWSSITGATGYVVTRNGVQIATPTGTTYTDTGLAVNTTYTYTVAAVVGGVTGPSSSITATTAALAKPILQLSVVGTSEIDLAWNPITGAASYRVTRDGVQIATGLTSTVYQNTGLTRATTYVYTVAAVPASGSPVVSDPKSATTQSGGSARRFGPIPGKQFQFTAHPANTDTIYIGDATVTETGGGKVLTELLPGEQITLDITNAGQLYWIAANGLDSATVVQTA